LKDNKVLIAYYRDGLQIFDVSTPSNPVRTGYFDTHPQNGSTYSGQPYQGAWGAYPFLPSGIVLVSDMQYGLFVLEANIALGLSSTNPENSNYPVHLAPNPADKLCLVFGINKPTKSIKIIDLFGRIVFAENMPKIIGDSHNLNLENILPGVYQLRIAYEDGTFSAEKLVKQ